MIDMFFDGQVLNWPGAGRFKATTGNLGYQRPTYQCVADLGPVPEGVYKVLIRMLGTARDDGTGRCNLSAAWGIQTIPRGAIAKECEPYWANWGHNRVRMEPADIRTKNACSPRRGGFYLHDSTKGFSHGCIEIESTFFPILKARAGTLNRTHLMLQVKYVSDRITYGGTRAK